MNFFGLLLVVALLGALTEAFQARTRRSLVREWVEEQGWTLISLRWRLDPVASKWSTTYWIVVLDRTGHSVEGIAHATGFIRRKVWVDW